MNELDVISWKSAISGLKLLGERLLKEKHWAVPSLKVGPMRKHEIKDIKRSLRFIRYILRRK
jgi:hypothetical protein